MILGYSSNAFKKYSIIETVNLIKQAGYGAIEIMCDVPHCYPASLSDRELAGLQKKLAETGLAVSNLNTFTLFAIGDMHHPSWIEKDARKRKQRLRHTVECIYLARELKCGNISIQPGGILEDVSREKALGYFTEGLEEAMEKAEENGVKILVEPEPELFLENSEDLKWFLARYSHRNLGLNCDIGHFYCAGEDPAEVITEFREIIGHVHIEDIAATREHNHLIPGRGAIAFKSVFKKLGEIHYDGFVSVELYPYQDDPAGAGAEAIKFLGPIMAASLNS